MTHKTYIKSNPQSLFQLMAKELTELANKANLENTYLTLVLPGGGTPKKFFEYLGGPVASQIAWSRIHFFWGDERCVPPSDSESNYGMAVKALFNKITLPAHHIHRIHGEASPEKESLRYAEEILNFVSPNISQLPVFDWIILGLGSDGHTASLFPPPNSSVSEDQICTTTTHPQSQQKRITMTLPVLNNARKLSFLVTGESKAAVVASIINNDSRSKTYPAAQVASATGVVEWFLDDAAALLL